MSDVAVATSVDTPAKISLEQLSLEDVDRLRSMFRAEVYKDAVNDAIDKLKESSDLEIAKTKDLMIKQNEETITSHIKAWEEAEAKKRTPITTEQIQKLLDQDYVTFKVRIANRTVSKEFVLSELPSHYEKKFFNLVKNTLKEAVGKFNSESIAAVTKGDWMEALEGIMDTFEPAFNTMAECVVICLNPLGDKGDPEITLEWVFNNVSSNRMLSILKAQIEINKLRDFFSELFQGFLSGGMTNPAGALL